MTRRLPARFLAPVALVATASVLRSQSQVWVVDDDPGAGVDFTSLQGAVDAAASGDVILIRSGSYPGFSIQAKSLALVADTGASVHVISGSSVRGSALSQPVLLRGFDSMQGGPNPPGEALLLKNNLGRVWIEDCVLAGAAGLPSSFADPLIATGMPALRIESSLTTALVRCTLLGGRGADLDDEFLSPVPGAGGAALSSFDGTLALYDCTLTGGNGGHDTDTTNDAGGAGGRGADLVGGQHVAANSSFAGGQGGAGGDGGTFSACGPGGAGGDGFRLDAAGWYAWTLGGSFSAGAGGLPGLPGAGGSCSPGASGLGLHLLAGTYTAMTGSVNGLEGSTPTREGQNQTLTFQGPSGALLFLAYGSDQLAIWYKVLNGALLVGPLFPTVQLLGTLPASGLLVKSFPIQELGAGVEAGVVYTQPIVCVPSTGVATAGAPSALVLLDSSL